MFFMVYVLWVFGDVYVFVCVEMYSEVLSKVLGGVDLMLSGVTSDVFVWMENELVVVYVIGNDILFVVGVIGCDVVCVVVSGMKGVGVRFAYAYGDAVWALGDKLVFFVVFL